MGPKLQAFNPNYYCCCCSHRCGNCRFRCSPEDNRPRRNSSSLSSPLTESSRSRCRSFSCSSTSTIWRKSLRLARLKLRATVLACCLSLLEWRIACRLRCPPAGSVSTVMLESELSRVRITCLVVFEEGRERCMVIEKLIGILWADVRIYGYTKEL